MARPPKIALVCPSSLPWMAQLVDGVRRYGLQHGGWQLLICPPTLHSLVGWQGDGAIAAIRNDDDREIVRRLGIPVVNISRWDADRHGIPRVGIDSRLAGRLAAEHLLDRGLRHFGYLGWQGVHDSLERLAGFADRLRLEGLPVEALLENPESNSGSTLVEDLRDLGDWLGSLPRPCGVFAVHNYRAQIVMEAAAGVGLRVPKDIAVVGMDDDAIDCEHTLPTLTSVCRDSARIGWEAAALIDRMRGGEDCREAEVVVPPEGIAERQSTDLLIAAHGSCPVPSTGRGRDPDSSIGGSNDCLPDRMG